MKTVVKLTIFALIITYSIVAFAILSPLLVAITGNEIFMSFGITISFLLLLTTWSISDAIDGRRRGIFSRLKDDEVTITWLLLHSLFTTTNKICIALGVISSFGPLFLVPTSTAFPTSFMVTWMIVSFTIVGLQRLFVLVGMGYRWFCKGRVLGTQSFADVAIKYLRRKEREGIAYLQRACHLLRRNLEYGNLELPELNTTIKIVRCLLSFRSEIPYDCLQMVASELKKTPNLECLPKTLSIFNESPHVRWTETFCEVKERKRRIQELIIIIIMLASAFATILPENSKMVLIETLSSIGSVENIVFLAGFVLMVVTTHIVSLDESFHLGPLKTKKAIDFYSIRDNINDKT